MNTGAKTSTASLPLWQRLGLTILVMIAASFLVALLWQALFSFPLPSYLSGMVGGLAAIPMWEFAKRIRPRTAT